MLYRPAMATVHPPAVAATRRWTLRVNVLEQCQYQCAYCLPGKLRPYTRKTEWLRADEYQRLGPVFAELGVRKVRITGGEPLLRDDLVEVCRALSQTMPSAEVALTTNGQLLGPRIEALLHAGLRGATVHVDSLRPDRYRALMGDGDVNEVLAAVLRARNAGLHVKINTVVQRGGNDDEIWDFLEWSRTHGVEVRFIELMNTGSARDYVAKAFVSGARIRERIAAREAITPLGRRHPSDPATLYSTASGLTFGLIASDSEPFCSDCNRLRLTPNGSLRGCLYAHEGLSIGDAMRSGATVERLRSMVQTAANRKTSWHPSLPRPRRGFSMSEAGG